ncbi:MAG TPA: hypothetical protein VHN37_11385 [Actinomycetota bacterium]|nr:hypothetical protein [Actinomycetota bacterium]
MDRVRAWLFVAAIATCVFVPSANAAARDDATTVVQGQWFNGVGTTACEGPLTSLTCSHSATSSEAFAGASVCFEAVAGTGVGSLGCTADLSGSSIGIGRKDLTCATRPANPLGANGTFNYYSPTLGQSFSIPVKISADNGTTYFQGTANFPLGTAHVEGTYSAGCDVEGVTYRGPFSGTFTAAVAL